jgi:hypothetical protein
MKCWCEKIKYYKCKNCETMKKFKTLTPIEKKNLMLYESMLEAPNVDKKKFLILHDWLDARGLDASNIPPEL